jgi:hypothetical protein
VILRALHAALRLLDHRKIRDFEAARRNPERAQALRLRRFLEANGPSAYGRAHGYARIHSVRAFQEQVPILQAEALAPWVARIAAGEPCILTRAPVRALEPTSGTTGGDRLIPFTDAFLAEMQGALAPWMADLFRARPALRGLRQYWSLSPATGPRRHTPGGIPVGIEDDTEYLGPLGKAALRRVMAVPGTLARTRDLDAWRRLTLLHLLKAEDLGLISVWSPSFLTLLMEALEGELPDYLDALPAPRARSIRMALDARGRLTGEALWPRLQVVSCWAHGPAARQIPALEAYFPRTPNQGKGLLATEGVVSFPLWEEAHRGSVAAATSHFLEFVDLQTPGATPRLLHELEADALYTPLLTTGGGLARYALRDALRCTGHQGQLPLLSFEGKLDGVSDRAGEKLAPTRVEAALEAAAQALRLSLRFALLAPGEGDPPGYLLFVESEADDEALLRLAHALDQALSADHHYGHCRALGQLAPITPRRVHDGWATFQRVRIASGMRPGQIKPASLDSGSGWGEAFQTSTRGRDAAASQGIMGSGPSLASPASLRSLASIQERK